MSRIDYKQMLECFITKYTVYCIEIYVKSISQKQFNAITRRFRDICNEFGVSGLLVLSTHASNGNLKTHYIKSKSPGRPKKVIAGDEVETHSHCCITGKNAHKAVEKASKYINKNFGENKKVSHIQCLGHTDHAVNFIAYCYRQADQVRTFGDYDFEKHCRYQ